MTQAFHLLQEAPYAEKSFGRRKLVDEKHLLLMQIALLPGQSVPLHNANSNVHILLLEGAIIVTLQGVEYPIQKGDLLPVAFGTPMTLRNEGSENATFTVWKTPNPSEMKSFFQ